MADGLTFAARNARCSLDALMLRIVRSYLLSDNTYCRTRCMPAELLNLSSKLQDQAKLREMYVRSWQDACREAVKDGRSVDDATTSFLERLERTEGLRITRGTLYNWRRQLEAMGPMGLVDRRMLERNPKSV